MDQLWRTELLGRLRVARADREITRFQTQKTGALLAYLAFFRDRPHPWEDLIQMLWLQSIWGGAQSASGGADVAAASARTPRCARGRRSPGQSLHGSA